MSIQYNDSFSINCFILIFAMCLKLFRRLSLTGYAQLGQVLLLKFFAGLS